MVIPLLTSTDGTDVIVHHQKFSGVFVLGLICLSLGQATTVQAGPLPVQYWAPAAGGGSSGTWTTSGSTWALTSGTTGTAAQNSAAKLIFGNAVGTVTVSGSVSTTATPTGMQLSTSGYLIVGGTIGLTGDITVDQGVTGTITSSIASGANGLIKSGSGTLSLSGSNTNLFGTAINGGTLVLGNAYAISSGSLAVNAGTLDLNGQSITIGPLNGGSGGAITTGTTGPITLTSSATSSTTFAGSIIDGAGTIAFTKLGNGKLTLSGSNTYSGGTTISGGTLALSGSGSIGTGGLDLGTNGIFELAALASGTYALPATGNLVGAGTISGNGKTLAVLGSFLPGNSPGTVTVGPGLRLDLSNSGTSVFQITSPLYTAGSFDLVNGTGSVTFGGILSLDFSGGSYSVGTNVLQIFANTGGLSGTFSSVVWTGLAAGQSASFDASTGYITIVPEPSACALITIGGCLAAFARRRRSRRPWPHRE